MSIDSGEWRAAHGITQAQLDAAEARAADERARACRLQVTVVIDALVWDTVAVHTNALSAAPLYEPDFACEGESDFGWAAEVSRLVPFARPANMLRLRRLAAAEAIEVTREELAAALRAANCDPSRALALLRASR